MKFTATAIAFIAASGANAFVPTSQSRSSSTALSVSYLEQLAGSNASPAASVKSYLDSIPAPVTRVAGAGFTSYLDTVAQGCDAVQPIEQCAEAITDYMSAISNGAADPVAESPAVGAQVIGNYLDHLASQATVISGAGIASYLDSVPSTPSRVGGPGMSNYIDSVVGGSTSSPAPSAPAVKSFLDSLASGENTAPVAPAVTNYLESMSNGNAAAPTSGAGIANYLSALPATNVRVGGAGIGSYLDSIDCFCDAVQPTEECAQAIGNYLDALSSGAAPASSTTAGASAIGNYLDALASNSALSGGAGFASYLDSVGGGSSAVVASAPAVKSYLDNLTTGASAAPSSEGVKTLLTEVSSGAAPTGSGIGDYLSSLPVANTRMSGAGIATYLNTVPSTSVRVGGAGMVSYLDSVNQACDTTATAECAQAIGNYMDALSSGAAPASSTTAGASAIGNYLDALASNSALSGGAGFASYLDSVGGGSSAVVASAPAVKSYLDNLTTGAAAAPSTPAVQSYLENVSSGAAAAPTSGAGIASYLEAMGTNSALSGGAGIASHVNNLPASAVCISGNGMSSYLDTVGGAISPAVSEVLAAVGAGAPTAGTPNTTIDTQVTQDGTKTYITITSVTTVVIDDAE